MALVLISSDGTAHFSCDNARATAEDEKTCFYYAIFGELLPTFNVKIFSSEYFFKNINQ